MNAKPIGTLSKIGATLALGVGSLLLYVFVFKLFARIWDAEAYLQSEFVGIAGGILLWRGAQGWPQWRRPLGIIWLLLGVLAFVNSTQYESLRDLPVMPGFRTGPEVLRAMAHASVVMGCVAFSLGAGLLFWQRWLLRRERGREPDKPECYLATVNEQGEDR